ncbi:hypothetical protein CGMCC3_g7326 [Colletotrichum fructicola]|nr:uncharacterized protein CGMCC3_g7326 [Colletotrichum fructicola]KAE9576512.1 hypothetical protein CGMCC3_g7326 [Colletotrichum fructicola]
MLRLPSDEAQLKGDRKLCNSAPQSSLSTGIDRAEHMDSSTTYHSSNNGIEFADFCEAQTHTLDDSAAIRTTTRPEDLVNAEALCGSCVCHLPQSGFRLRFRRYFKFV